MNYALMGQKIKLQRKKIGYTQDQLAELVGISASFMGHIERGTRVMSLDTFHRLCVVLDMSADVLLDIAPSGQDNAKIQLALQHLQAAIDIFK